MKTHTIAVAAATWKKTTTGAMSGSFFPILWMLRGCDFLDQSSTQKKNLTFFLAFSHGKTCFNFVVFAVTLFYLNLCMRITDTLFLSFLPKDEA